MGIDLEMQRTIAERRREAGEKELFTKADVIIHELGLKTGKPRGEFASGNIREYYGYGLHITYRSEPDDDWECKRVDLQITDSGSPVYSARRYCKDDPQDRISGYAPGGWEDRFEDVYSRARKIYYAREGPEENDDGLRERWGLVLGEESASEDVDLVPVKLDECKSTLLVKKLEKETAEKPKEEEDFEEQGWCTF